MSETTTQNDKAMRIATERATNPDMVYAVDSRGRTFGLKTLGPAAMLNVIEMAGGSASENQTWLRMAMMIAGVSSIDGMPVPVAKTKASFLDFAEKVGNEGLIAISDATTKPTDDKAADAAAPADREAELATARSS